MSKGKTITAKKRASIPRKQFGLPAQRKYPVDTRARAANAKARASQMYKEGKLSASQKAQIFAAANKRLAKG